jgi:rod shape-determining protein MreC
MRAIVSGTGDLGHLKMEYVPTSAEIKVGEKVYSSGLGEHFPAGYLVGTISKSVVIIQASLLKLMLFLLHS